MCEFCDNKDKKGKSDDSDSYKPKPKKISRIKKPSVKNIKANFEWNTDYVSIYKKL